MKRSVDDECELTGYNGKALQQLLLYAIIIIIVSSSSNSTLKQQESLKEDVVRVLALFCRFD
jgi:hypothetical protein